MTARSGIGLMVLVFLLAAGPARAGDAPLSFSTDPATSADQHAAYDLVHRYETLLNAGDAAGIVALFAPDGIAEWNGRRSFATREQKLAGYGALFRIAKFDTVFGYASIDVHGDTAMVRTYHHKGASVLERGKPVPDLNREVFVLRKLGQDWKIAFYMFNTDPVQGEG